MKTIKQRLTDIRGRLLGIEMDLHLLERELDDLKDSLAFLEQTESDLKYNINMHKKPGIISIAKEYQKTVWQLGVVEKHIVNYKKDICNIQQKIEKKEEDYQKTMLEYESTFRHLEEERDVLPFVLREKR